MRLDGTFGGWLKQRRKALDLTQSELAQQVNCAVVTIRKFEADAARPSKQIAERLADVLAIADEERAAFVLFARRVAAPSGPITPHIQNLPPQSTPFIGKSDELRQIKARLADPECRLLTLVGVGGSGKTRLALEAAVDSAAQFPDGHYFVSLTSIDHRDLLPAAIGDALKFAFLPSDNPQMQIINLLREKRLLLILDSFEHLLDGGVFVSALLQAAPRVKLLVTSRERLHLRQEWVLTVSGMAYPVQPNAAEGYDAVRLFEQSARRVLPDYALADHLPEVMQICRAVEGLPLAIELAATWLRAMPTDQIARQIQRDADFLSTTLRDVPERHRSIRTVFDYSWRFLSQDEQRVLAALSVFRGGFEREAALQIAETTLSVLAGLIDKSLLRMAKSGRFDVHDLLRQYAAEQLAAGQSEMLRQQHARYYGAFLNQHEPLLLNSQQLGAMNEITADWDNIRMAWDWAVNCRDFDTLDLMIESVYLYGLEFRIAELRVFWEQALSQCAPLEGEPLQIAWGRLLARSVFVLGVKGQDVAFPAKTMQAAVDTAMKIAHDHALDEEIAYATWANGVIQLNSGRPADAIPLFERSAAIYTEQGNRLRAAFARQWKAICTRVTGDWQSARDDLHGSLAVYRELGNEFEAGWVLLNLGTNYVDQSDVVAGERHIREAFAIHQRFGSPFACSLCEIYLAYMAIWSGEFALPESNIYSVLSFATERSSHFDKLHALNLVAVFASLRGDYDEALRLYEQSSLLPTTQHVLHFALYWGRALAYIGSGQFDPLKQMLTLMDSFAHSKHSPVATLIATPLHAILLAHMGQTTAAAQLLGFASRHQAAATAWMNRWLPIADLRYRLEAQLGSEAFQVAYAGGQQMRVDEIETLAAIAG
jgi:predicted ATPase/DNA-binding XRE family transcriptional regulator